MMIPLSHRQMKRRLLNRFGSRSKAFSFVEMVIASLIFLMVGIFVAYLVMVAARMTKDGFQSITRDSRARFAMEIVRRHLLVAETGTVTVSTDGHTITYSDPTVDDPANPGSKITMTSSLVVEATSTRIPHDAQNRFYKRLIYKQDATSTSSGDWIVYRDLGLADMKFTLGTGGNLVKVALTTVAQQSKGAGGKVTGNKSSQITLTDDIMFRNATN